MISKQMFLIYIYTVLMDFIAIKRHISFTIFFTVITSFKTLKNYEFLHEKAMTEQLKSVSIYQNISNKNFKTLQPTWIFITAIVYCIIVLP